MTPGSPAPSAPARPAAQGPTSDRGPQVPADVAPAARAIRPRAFALELTKGCNLRCGYCYYAGREDAYQPATTMAPATAEAAVETLLREGPPGEPVHLHFFGGEPLLNLPLLRHVADYGRRRAAEEGRTITFEITTNGTRFTDEVIAFLDEHRFQVGVSFDGPPEVQDDARPQLGGGSSYAAALPGIRRFLAARAGTPLEAKTHCSVVVTRRELDLVKIARHLEALGFRKIILSPATDLEGKGHAIRPEDLPALLLAYDALAADHEARLREGRPSIDTWFEGLLQQLLSGERKTAFCEGGRDYLGVAADGQAYLCYRFYEQPEYAMGSVQAGIDRGVTERLLSLPVEKKPACSTCWARWFCGGGCHHENLITTGGLGEPNPVTCEILRHGMDLTLGMWARLSRDGRVAGRAPVTRREGGAMAATNPEFRDEDRPRRKDSCHVREIDGADGRKERVVYEPVSHEVVVLNGTASLIFDLCDGTRTVAGMAAALGGRFAAPADVLRRDLLQTLELFRAKSLLV